MNKMFKRYFHTVRYLKTRQIYYQIRYRIKRVVCPLSKGKYPLKDLHPSHEISLLPFIAKAKSYDVDNGNYTFLNISSKSNCIGAQNHLWRYNFHYMDYLLQEDISQEMALQLIDEYIDQSDTNIEGLASYTIALRGINWIKFLCLHKISIDKVNASLYTHYQILMRNIEYHLLGNHLLENGFSLLWGGVYFQDRLMIDKGVDIILSELDEQVLCDGAHFELSPMYHCIILDRLLDCINLLENCDFNFRNRRSLELKMVEKSTLMLSWLETIIYRDGSIPLLNDSAMEIAPSACELFSYAKRLGIKWCSKIELIDSGYYKLITSRAECIVDVGEILASYIPGHSHADTFNFELRINGVPIIVDPGVSTYEKNEIRQRERSTAWHNTVVAGEQNSSDVWGGFRVGKRAKVTILNKSYNLIEAIHDGYSKIGLKHRRRFELNDSELIVNDEMVTQSKNPISTYAMFHLHPLVMCDDLKIEFMGANSIERITYLFPLGYNKLVEATALKVCFKEKLQTKIKI